LEAALARPASYALYEHADLSLQAAALAHGVAEGQFFIEGNKRVALAALHTFLLVDFASRPFRILMRLIDSAVALQDRASGGSTMAGRDDVEQLSIPWQLSSEALNVKY